VAIVFDNPCFAMLVINFCLRNAVATTVGCHGRLCSSCCQHAKKEDISDGPCYYLNRWEAVIQWSGDEGEQIPDGRV
jgi:hypothetical protein